MSRAVQCMQEVIVDKCTSRKIYEINNLNMTQSSLVGAYERLRGICCLCFQVTENFFLNVEAIHCFLS